MSDTPTEDNILDSNFSISKEALVQTFASSISMHAHLDREKSADMPEDEKIQRAEQAYDHMAEVIGFDSNTGTVSDFIEAVKTDEAQSALESVPSYSTTLTLNRHIIASLDYELNAA